MNWTARYLESTCPCFVFIIVLDNEFFLFCIGSGRLLALEMLDCIDGELADAVEQFQLLGDSRLNSFLIVDMLRTRHYHYRLLSDASDDEPL